MKKKNNFRVSAIFATVMLFCAVMFAGCVAETDQEMPAGSGEGNLYISIKTESIDGKTRGVTIVANPDATYENYMGKTLICIFDTENKLVQYKAVPDLSSVVLNGPEQFDGKSYAANYTVAAISNLPSTPYNNLVTALNGSTVENPYLLTTLRQVQLQLADALDPQVLSPATAADRRIPMYGEGQLVEVVEGETHNFYADVQVKHSLVKVSLKQLVVDFGESSTRNATFKPDQVFLTNVPDVTNVITSSVAALDFDAATDPNVLYQGDGALYYAKDATDQAAYTGTKTVKVKTDADKYMVENDSLLGTGILTGSELKTLSSTNSNWLTADNSANREYYFYTVPSSQTGNTATCLVVSGMFNATGSGNEADEKRVYYRVKLNGTGTGDGALAANTNYKVNMIIRGKGGEDAYTDGVDPTLVESYVTTGNFEDDTEDAVLGVGAANYSTYTDGHIVLVGDILFSDGVFKSQSKALDYHTSNTTAANGVVPIGIVFHLFNAVEAADTDAYPTYHGYKGLVMALKDATDSSADPHAGVKWGIKEAKASNVLPVPLDITPHTSADTPDAATATTLMRSAASNLKGINIAGNNGWDNWAKTTALREDGYDSNASNAFKVAAAFDADNNGSEDGANKTWTSANGTVETTGWFLPSIGELYKMCYSLGKLQTSKMNTSAWGKAGGDEESKDNWTPWGMYFTNGQARVDENSKGIADEVRININDMIDACGDGTYTAFYGGLNPIGTTSTAADWGAYWSSSEWSGGYAFTLYFHYNGNLIFNRGNNKSSAYRVRPVLAFK